MLRQGFHLEYKVDDKSCRLITDNDASLDFIKESLFQFQKYVGQIEDNIKLKQEEEKKKAEDDKKKSEEEKSDDQRKE